MNKINLEGLTIDELINLRDEIETSIVNGTVTKKGHLIKVEEYVHDCKTHIRVTNHEIDMSFVKLDTGDFYTGMYTLDGETVRHPNMDMILSCSYGLYKASIVTLDKQKGINLIKEDVLKHLNKHREYELSVINGMKSKVKEIDNSIAMVNDETNWAK